MRQSKYHESRSVAYFISRTLKCMDKALNDGCLFGDDAYE